MSSSDTIAQQQQPPPSGYYQQPAPQTTIVFTQPTRADLSNIQNTRDWSTGLCGCFEDCGICAFAFFCGPIYCCFMAHELNESACGPWLCGSNFVTALRTKIRTMYGIRGSIMDDACCIQCCTFCAVTQMHREFRNQRQRVI